MTVLKVGGRRGGDKMGVQKEPPILAGMAGMLRSEERPRKQQITTALLHASIVRACRKVE